MRHRIRITFVLLACLLGVFTGCEHRPYPQPLDARDNLPPPGHLDPAAR
jgi:hypothetical protein